MADCPKCGAHLRLADWKQKCPHCGANVFLYDLQERLMRDADLAEVQHYHFQNKVDRAKASYIGSGFAIARICTSLLPAGAVFLPLFLVKNSAVGLPEKADAIRLYEYFSEQSGAFFGALPGDKTGAVLFAALLCLVLSLLLWLIHFALLFLSCSPRGKARNYALSAGMLLFSLTAVLLVFFLPEGTFAAAAPGLGAVLYLLLCAVNLIVEIATFRKGIPIEHKQCYVGGIPIEEYFELQKAGTPPEEIRAEQYRRLTALQLEKERALEKEDARTRRGEKEANGNE